MRIVRVSRNTGICLGVSFFWGGGGEGGRAYNIYRYSSYRTNPKQMIIDFQTGPTYNMTGLNLILIVKPAL